MKYIFWTELRINSAFWNVCKIGCCLTETKHGFLVVLHFSKNKIWPLHWPIQFPIFPVFFIPSFYKKNVSARAPASLLQWSQQFKTLSLTGLPAPNLPNLFFAAFPQLPLMRSGRISAPYISCLSSKKQDLFASPTSMPIPPFPESSLLPMPSPRELLSLQTFSPLCILYITGTKQPYFLLHLDLNKACAFWFGCRLLKISYKFCTFLIFLLTYAYSLSALCSDIKPKMIYVLVCCLLLVLYEFR